MCQEPSHLPVSFLFLIFLLFASGSDAVIKWANCTDLDLQSSLPYDCANLNVPLDYTDSELNKTLTLRLARVPAKTGPSKGTILFNFGGPSDTGRETLTQLSYYLQPSTGNQYDLVAIEPRGTGKTIPLRCATTELEALGLSDDISTLDPGRLWAGSEVLSNSCYNASKDIGSLIGTSFVARDIMSVVDALEEDNLLRYWGFSYGTVLGAVLAAMFPERIDKMTLDGITNPHAYFHSFFLSEQVADSDKEFSALFEFCAQAGPSNCSLVSRDGQTGTELENDFWSLVESVKSRPLVLGGSFVLDDMALKGFAKQSLYGSIAWPKFTELLSMIYHNATAHDILDLLAVFGPTNSSTIAESFITEYTPFVGISCSDSIPRTSTLDELLPYMNAAHQASRLMGDQYDSSRFPCARWKFDAKERYTGDFYAKTKNPVLLLSNTYDGITPYAAAQNLTTSLEGSRILKINGYGHTSSAAPSTCALKHHRAYWLNGTLPDEGTVCDLDGDPELITWAKVIRGLNSTSE